MSTQIIKFTCTCHQRHKMSVDLVSSSNCSAYFPSTDHYFQVSVGFEDEHVTQMVKILCLRYLMMRLHTYSKLCTREVINKSAPSSIIPWAYLVWKYLTSVILFFQSSSLAFIDYSYTSNIVNIILFSLNLLILGDFFMIFVLLSSEQLPFWMHYLERWVGSMASIIGTVKNSGPALYFFQ